MFKMVLEEAGSSTAYPTLLPNSTAYSQPDLLLQYSNDALGGGVFGLAVLIMFMGVVLLSSSNSPFPQRLLATSFVGLVISTLLAGGGLINVFVPPALLFTTVIIWFAIKDN